MFVPRLENLAAGFTPRDPQFREEIGSAVTMKNHLCRVFLRLAFYLSSQLNYTLVVGVGNPEKERLYAPNASDRPSSS